MRTNPALKTALRKLATEANKSRSKTEEPVEVLSAANTPTHRETPSENIARLRKEGEEDRARERLERQEQKKKEPRTRKEPTREELLARGWVKAQRIRGQGHRNWTVFTAAEWDAMTFAERCCFQVQRSADPGNKFQITAKGGGSRGTRVISALSGIRRF